VASRPDPRASRALLGAALAAAFALSATSDARLLCAAAAVAALAFRRGIARTARRVLRSVVPVTAVLSMASWAWLRLVTGRVPATEPFVALGLRTVVIAFVMFAVLARVDLFRALAPWPTLSRLLVVTLAQIHALRLLVTESLLGLRSRMPRKPGTVDVVRGAGGLTGALFTLSARNARDISDAMRSRGFS
jgi:cobalt/nickel transport system permease protein